MQEKYSKMKVKYALNQQGPDSQDEAGALHLEVAGTATDPGTGPSALKDGGKVVENSGGKRAINLLKDIMADSNAAEKQTLQSEKDGQVAYEGFIQATNKSVATNNND